MTNSNLHCIIGNNKQVSHIQECFFTWKHDAYIHEINNIYARPAASRRTFIQHDMAKINTKRYITTPFDRCKQSRARRSWAQTAIASDCWGRWFWSWFPFVFGWDRFAGGFGLVSVGLGDTLFAETLPLLVAGLIGVNKLRALAFTFLSVLLVAFVWALFGLVAWTGSLVSHGRAAIHRSTQLHPQSPVPNS